MPSDVTVKFDADTQAYELGQQRMLTSNAANLKSLQQIDAAMARMRALQAQQGAELAKLDAEAAAAAQKRRDATEKAAQGTLLVGVAMMAAFAGAAIEAAAFDKAMSGVHAATLAGSHDMSLLRQAALDAGAATSYSATEAANAETELAKAGVSVTNIVNGGLRGALALAAAGQLDVASAAEDAATAMNDFHLAGTQTSHVADLYAAAAGKAQGSVQDLAGAMKYVGPVADGLNVSIEQTTGTLALFASNGVIGEQAGTSLRGVISSLTSPSQQAAGEMKTLGINVFNAQGNFIGLDGVAGQLHDRLGNLTQAQRAQALGMIFGNEQLTGANLLYQAGAKGVDDWTKKVNDSGYAARQAAAL